MKNRSHRGTPLIVLHLRVKLVTEPNSDDYTAAQTKAVSSTITAPFSALVREYEKYVAVLLVWRRSLSLCAQALSGTSLHTTYLDDFRSAPGSIVHYAIACVFIR